MRIIQMEILNIAFSKKNLKKIMSVYLIDDYKYKKKNKRKIIENLNLH